MHQPPAAAARRGWRRWSDAALRRLARGGRRSCPRCGRSRFSRLVDRAQGAPIACGRCRLLVLPALLGLLLRLLGVVPRRVPGADQRVDALVAATKRRVADTILDSLADRGLARPHFASRPLVVYWLITARCPNACPHCLTAGLRDGAEVDGAGLARLADRIVEARVPWVTITGGEPLVRPELPALVARFAEADTACFLISSGAGLTPDLADRLADAGLARFLVSVDGPAALHDQVRGPGSHAAALHALALLGGGRIPFGISATLHGGNVEALEYLRGLARDTGSSFLFVNEYIPSALGVPAGLSPLDAAQRDRLYRDLFRLKAEDSLSPWAGRCRFEATSPLASVWAIQQAAEIRGRGRVARWFDRLDRGTTLGCGAGRTQVALLPDGSVTPCFAWHHPVGNLFDRSLAEIWNGPALGPIRRGFEARCAPCTYAPVCGGCAARRLALGQDTGCRDPACPTFVTR